VRLVYGVSVVLFVVWARWCHWVCGGAQRGPPAPVPNAKASSAVIGGQTHPPDGRRRRLGRPPQPAVGPSAGEAHEYPPRVADAGWDFHSPAAVPAPAAEQGVRPLAQRQDPWAAAASTSSDCCLGEVRRRRRGTGGHPGWAAGAGAPVLSQTGAAAGPQQPCGCCGMASAEEVARRATRRGRRHRLRDWGAREAAGPAHAGARGAAACAAAAHAVAWERARQNRAAAVLPFAHRNLRTEADALTAPRTKPGVPAAP